MEIRRQELEEPFGISPERMFQTLTTPSAIRIWFGASTAIVEARQGGSWIAAFGERESDTDFVTAFEILKFEPPKRLLLGAGKFISDNKWPLATNMTTEFIIERQPAGCILRIIQQLAPKDPLLDDYFDACVVGWQNSFEGIRNYLHANPVH